MGKDKKQRALDRKTKKLQASLSEQVHSANSSQLAPSEFNIARDGMISGLPPGSTVSNEPHQLMDLGSVDKTTLWDNPMVNAAKSQMTPSQLEAYRKMGEKMYGGMNFENLEQRVEESAHYLLETVKSGLHPSYLTESDKTILKNVAGDKWYEPFGYTEKDLTEINVE